MEIKDDHRQWLLDSVRYFRAMEFFSQDAGLSDDALVERIVAEEQFAFWELPEVESLWEHTSSSGDAELDEYFERLARPRRDQRDFCLTLRDTQRIWFEDGEDDIRPGDNRYIRTLQEWSDISRGAFLPTGIREVWHQPERWPDCQVVIHFFLNGQECILEPWSGYGWLDFGLLNGINPLIADSGYSYAEWDTGVDQRTCLVVLTGTEKHRLTAERGWEFSDVVSRGYGFREL